jgi:integrase
MAEKDKKGRRRFGNVRQRASGRWQARYVGPDGLMRTAPYTFESERKAERWLTLVESEIIRNLWRPPEAGEVELDGYAAAWVAERKLAPRTREGYEDLLRLHIRPHLGHLMVAAIRPQTVRAWRRKLLETGTTEPQAVKAYCLLRAVLNTAVREDRLIVENPCRIRGFDRYHTPERPTATIDQVYRLAELVPERYRALIMVAALTGVRWGELVALRRMDVDLDEAVVRVPRKLAALRNRMEFGPPKSEAGRRVVALPSAAVDELRVHLAEFVGPASEALVFTGRHGALLRSGNFLRAVDWPVARVKAGLPANFHFHDLRHTGNNLAAASGASTRELMHRMGHSSMRAALIYQHATSERDREIAARIDKRLAEQRSRQEAAQEERKGPE